MKKNDLRDIVERGLAPQYPNTPYEKRGENEESYRQILRSEAEALVTKALSEAIDVMAFPKKGRSLEEVAEENMVGLCLAYGNCRALKEPSGHLHSMTIDFQGYFLGKYLPFEFKLLSEHNPVPHASGYSG